MHIIIIRYLAKIWLCGKMYVFGNIAGVAERHAYNYYPVSDQIFVLRLLAMIGIFSVTFHFVKIRSVLYAHLAWYSLRLWDSHLKKSNILAKLNAEMEIFRSSIATHPASYSVYLWDCPFNKSTVLPKLTAEMEMFWSRIAAHLACQTEQNTGGGGRRCLLRRLRWWRHVGHLFGDALAVVAVAVCCVGWVSGGGGDGRGDCWALNKNTCW